MPPKKLSTTWEAKPHTIAKIEILRKYLTAWFLIMGQEMAGREILYVDAFAGPGGYTNHSEGSPIAALVAAKEALSNPYVKWRAGSIHAAFIEKDSQRFEHLSAWVAPFQDDPRISIHRFNSDFADGLNDLERLMPKAFNDSDPLFVFLDPFGTRDVPFSVVSSLLKSPRSEILLNFDADGMSRIFRSGESSNFETILTFVYGNDSWRRELTKEMPFSELCRTAKDLYLKSLRSLPKIRYTFPFEMQSSRGLTNYYLIFAGQHPLGLRKMKEAMKSLDKSNQYRFCDAHVGQTAMFQWDMPEEFAPKLLEAFAGKEVSLAEVTDYALNETPFTSATSMLKTLQRDQKIELLPPNPSRRKGSFKVGDVEFIKFIKGD